MIESNRQTAMFFLEPAAIEFGQGGNGTKGMEAYPNSKSKENQFPLFEWGKISYTHVLDLDGP